MEPIVRFGFMHVMSVNWCVWIRSLTQETLESFLHHENTSIAIYQLQHEKITSNISDKYQS